MPVSRSVTRLTHAMTLCGIRSYAIENDVIYLVLCDKGFPKGNAFAYLEDIQQEFGQLHGDVVATQARPYALISFGASHNSRVPP